MTYSTYEITAFSEVDLLSAGDHNLGCGDTFTMPGSATVCISVTDNDSILSGDNWCNENANDKSGQTALITGENGAELGNGGQIYAESYYWVSDQNGNWYVMIEVEQEGTDDDYFTFYTGNGYSVPPEGAVLTVGSQCNVKGNWVDYKCLDAGEKEATGSISGTVFCDVDCDGINGEVTTVPGCDYTIEAEDMWGWGFQTVHGANASGGDLVKLNCAGGNGLLCTTFNGKQGVYDVKIRVQDENDGQSVIKLKVNGQFVEAIRLDADSDGGGSNDGGFSTYVIKDVDLSAGDDISIKAFGDGYEFVRIDNIVLEGQDQEVRTEEPVKEGVTIKLIDAATGAVVATTMTDANGEYEFADVPVGDYKIMGVAPDGTEFTIQDAGNDDSIDSDVDANGMSGVITVTADSENDIDLGLKEAKPELGSLSGRYFCDTDNDDVDDGNATDPGIAGVVVTLKDAGGNIVGTTVTAGDGTYSFEDLAAGDYSVEFTDPDGVLDGKVLVADNVGGDDSIDSDAIGDTTLSTIDNITVVGGQNTPDNDAGAEELGSLSGRYFCDENEDGLDNEDDNGLEGVTVELLDANGQQTGRTTTTDAQGNYSFAMLVPGIYGVKFTDTSGKTLTTQNVDGDVSDDIDSDAADLGNGMSQILGITVNAGQDTPDNDAGVFEPNENPTATDDMGKGCADEEITVDFSDNFSDADSTSVGITMIDGVAIAAGETVNIGGVNVTLTAGDEFIFDGETAYADLDIGQEATQSFEVKVEDSDGGFATATIDVTFCGDANSVASFCDSLPSTVSYQVQTSFFDADPANWTAFGYDVKIVSAGGDARFEGIEFTAAYCLDEGDPLSDGASFATAPIVTGDLLCLDEVPLSFWDASQTGVNGLGAAENVDLINYILNQDYEGQGFTGYEVQSAIWALTDGYDYTPPLDFFPQLGDAADVDSILADAFANGEGFQAGVGDVIGVVIDPNPATAQNEQPFVLAINFEDYDCLC